MQDLDFNLIQCAGVYYVVTNIRLEKDTEFKIPSFLQQETETTLRNQF